MSSRSKADTAIMRSARRLLWVVAVASALMVVLYLSARIGAQFGGARVEYGPHEGTGRTSLFLGDIGLVLLLIALARLAQMLGTVARGELFSATVIRRFRGFAFWLLLMAIVDLSSPLFAELFARRAGDPVRLIIDFRQVLTVGVTLLLFLLARLFERARQIEEENREFV